MIQDVGHKRCSRCNVTFIRDEHLQRHLQRHQQRHQQHAHPSSRAADTNGSTNRPRCDDCGRDFNRIEHLKRHLRHIHNTDSLAPESGASPSAPNPGPNSPGTTDVLAMASPNPTPTVVNKEERPSIMGEASQKTQKAPTGKEPSEYTRISYLALNDGLERFTAAVSSRGSSFGGPSEVGSSDKVKPSPFTISDLCYDNLVLYFTEYVHVPDFKLPSRQVLVECLGAWHNGLAQELPMIHVPTFDVEMCSFRQFLALTSLGAQQLCLSEVSSELFRAAMILAYEPVAPEEDDKVEAIQNLILLLMYCSRAEDTSIASSGTALQRTLVDALNGADAGVPDTPDWASWIAAETRRRIMLIAFCFLNWVTLAYNEPHTLLISPAPLRLPCSAEEWEAASSDEWEAIHNKSLPPPTCEMALVFLLTPPKDPLQATPVLSSWGLDVMLHVLLQRIYRVRRQHPGSLDGLSQIPLPRHQAKNLRTALDRWIVLWQHASADNTGPVPFTTVSLLCLAHARLHMDIGPFRPLQSRDPVLVAEKLFNTLLPIRNLDIIPALLSAIHLLSIPVQQGMDVINQHRLTFWSCQNTLCCLEAALLLTGWLFVVKSGCDSKPLDAYEEHVLDQLQAVLTKVSGLKPSEIADPINMGAAVVQTWSRMFTGNSPWPISKTIGDSLRIFAHTYENPTP